MNLNKMKNFVIITLVIAAVYQTGELWLEDVTSHNFFYSLFLAPANADTQANTDGVSIMPKSIAIGYGNKKYQKFYGGEEYNALIKTSYAMIKSAVETGRKSEVAPMDWDSYLKGKTLFCLFDFPLSPSEFMKSLGESTAGVETKLKYFNVIALLPGRTAAEETSLYFINTEAGEAVSYTLEREKDAPNLYAAIEEFQQASSDQLFYISAKENGFHIFSENTFLPQWVEEQYRYPPYLVKSPFEENGRVVRPLLETGVEGFFENHMPDWNAKDGEAYIFSDENIVVKYFPSQVLEYYDYHSTEGKKEQTLSSAYAVADQFLNKDKTLSEELYLSNVAFGEAGLTFYFDYSLGDFPVAVSEALKEETGISHAVEIVVQNNRVRRYKRYVVTFDEAAVEQYADLDFSAALDRVIGENKTGVPVTNVEEIDLVYYIDGSGQANLYWYLELDGKGYFYSAKRQE